MKTYGTTILPMMMMNTAKRTGPLVGCLSCDVQQKADETVRHQRPVSVGTVRQTFADDFVVASSCNLRRDLGRAIKHPDAVLKADKPWEDDR